MRKGSERRVAWLNKEVKLGSGTEEEGEVELDRRGRCGVGHKGRERDTERER